MENLSYITEKRKNSSDMKWVTSEWLVADWRPQYAPWESNCSSTWFSQYLLWGRRKKKVFCSLFKLQEGCQSVQPLSILKDKQAAKELLSHPDQFGQTAGVRFLQTPGFLFWVWELLGLAWVFQCLVLVCHQLLYLNLVYGTKFLVVLHCTYIPL